jgi:hypothetical protein
VHLLVAICRERSASLPFDGVRVGFFSTCVRLSSPSLKEKATQIFVEEPRGPRYPAFPPASFDGLLELRQVQQPQKIKASGLSVRQWSRIAGWIAQDGEDDTGNPIERRCGRLDAIARDGLRNPEREDGGDVAKQEGRDADAKGRGWAVRLEVSERGL